MAKSKYNRVLLKLSGQSFCRPGGFGIDAAQTKSIAERVAHLCELGPQVAVVVGAGNFLRGEGFSGLSGIPRDTADYMGMLATIINACALQGTLEKLGQPSRVLSALEFPAMCERFVRRRALHHLEQGRVVILAGGTGNPFFTTDTAAALRAEQIDADIILKGTKVDGVYDDDPQLSKDAVKYDVVDFMEVIRRGLRVMDLTAITFCRDYNIPILVFNIMEPGNLNKVISGQIIGTLVKELEK